MIDPLTEHDWSEPWGPTKDYVAFCHRCGIHSTDAEKAAQRCPDVSGISRRDDYHLRGSVECIVFRDGKILAVNSRNFEGFCGVGGKVERGESFEQAARRELMEETGCEALSLRFIAGTTLDPIKGDDSTIRWYCAGFIADIGQQQPRACEAGTVPFWTTKEEMLNKGMFPEWYKWWFGLLDKLGEMK